MARLSFRQGIVRHQTDTIGNPTFLQKVGLYVNLLVSPDPTIITFVHGTTNYLFTDNVTTNNAWGPFPPGPDVWLYWDLNRVTGVRTFGHTTYEPIESAAAPTSPATGQMWFNTAFNIWYEWNGAAWVEVLRVFAAKYANSTALVSMSINSPEFTGTQVGLTTDITVGSLMYDGEGNPIVNSKKQFFTTEDVFTTGVPTGASLKVNNVILRAQAQQPIGAYNVVVYSNFNKIIPAFPFTVLNRVYGITEEGANVDDVVNVVTEGIIFNENWDWPANGANVNDPVYIDNTGQIVLSPVASDELPVGAVIGPQSILFDPTLYGITTISGGGGGTQTCLIDGDGDTYIGVSGTAGIPCTDINSGDIFIQSGSSTIGNVPAGDIFMTSGTGDINNDPGDIFITAEDATDRRGGEITILAKTPAYNTSVGQVQGGTIKLATQELYHPITIEVGAGADGGATILPSWVNFTATRNVNNTKTPEFRFCDITDPVMNWIGVKCPDIVPASYTLTLPPTDGLPGQVLTTDGFGVTTFEYKPYDTMFTKFGTITDSDIINRSIAPRNVSIGETSHGTHYGYCDVAPTGTAAVFTVYTASQAAPDTFVSRGTITFAVGSRTATTISLPLFGTISGDHIIVQATTASGIEGPHIMLAGFSII